MAKKNNTKTLTVPVKPATLQLELDTANEMVTTLKNRIKNFETEVQALSTNNSNLVAELSSSRAWGTWTPILGAVVGALIGVFVL